MMLPADMALLTDPELRDYVELFAGDEDEFFRVFSCAFGKVRSWVGELPPSTF